MASSALSGVRSPASPRSGATSPRPNKFDSDQLKTYIKKLLASTVQNVTWPEFKERERGRALMKEIGDRVKERMLEIEPRGFKYIVLTQVNENVGQGGRADVACHWEDSDTVVQEVLVTDSLICICIAFAVRTV
ncbi:hypothetical protein DFH94DRAFT_623859 [Russula ochroleuca]|uniref:Topoisomerase I damage affected protein 2 n=1 Tax=Russula ochroleuca TaxID=152965 RepID=A0A9P5N2R9_9AGAM|nr:hypothetical protein DFH94DRAFT_623859 [Russula ochroleuca]